MLVLQHNLLSMFAQRELNIVTGQKAKNAEKLSSGYKINRSADDAAGLSISEKMRQLIRGLGQSADNIQDGVSLIQTGEGALNEVHDMLHRIRELAVKASNVTNSVSDMNDINKEIQDIKKEMNRVYNTTEFNTKYLFKAPYVPDIEGVPNDFELFNGPDGKTPAGVLINNKRYTFGELGVPAHSSTDWVKEIKDPDHPDELIRLKLKAGDPPEKIHRVYVMTADDDGILINNLRAGLWGSTISQNGNNFSFSYRGMDLSIDADSGDLNDIINRLRTDNITENSWDAIPIESSGNRAVSSTRDTMTYNVTNGNKNSIESWAFRIEADDTGVGLVQTAGDDGITHTKTKWEDFSNVNGGASLPISDWGTEDEGNNPVTLDSSALYRYTDGGSAAYLTNGMSFDFNFLKNEASKAQTINGLTQNLSGSAVSSPIRTVTGDNVTVTGYSGLSNYHLQRDVLNRDFGDSGSSAAMKVSVERTMVKDSTVTDHEWRMILTEAYAKELTTFTDKRITTYTGIDSEKFYELDGTTEMTDTSEVSAYDNAVLAQKTENNINSGSSFQYVANTGLSAGWTSSVTSGVSSTPDTEVVRRDVFNSSGIKIGVVDITFNKTIDVERTTNKSYERNGSDLKNYKKNGANYEASSYNTYYVMDGSASDKDVDDNTYRAADGSDGSAQRYLQTGETWKAIKTYDLDHYTYSGKNSGGTTVMSSSGGQFLKTDGSATSITIHDNLGHTHTYNTENTGSILNTTISGNGASISLRYGTGSGNKTSEITITPNGPATRTFTKGTVSGGSSSNTELMVKVNPPEKHIPIQAGPQNLGSNVIDLNWPALSNSIVGISGAGTSTLAKSRATMDMADVAIEMISNVRSLMGALQNRLEHAYKINKNTEENTQSAESKIRDTDIPEEMVQYSKNNILSEAGRAMLSQANHQPESILSLLS